MVLGIVFQLILIYVAVLAPNVESDSDHEPSSTVTIPTPPRTNELDESHTIPAEDLAEKTVELNDSAIAKDLDASQSPIRSPMEFVWKGTISMVDVAQISITGHEVSGKCLLFNPLTHR